MNVSIIVPCKEIDSMTIRCISECLKLDYESYEIIVLPDNSSKKSKDDRLRIINTGKVKPALKRNVGMENARGKFFAFIDSDAYPKKDWLKNAMKYFSDKKVGLVGGPNLTPRESNFAEKISGKVLSNFLVSGEASIRYKIVKNKYTNELPSCNYISRREISPKYTPYFLTAEDSKFCFDISKKGYEILYAGDVRVYHHRRDNLFKHLKQMFIYGRDIAWLSKKEFTLDKIYYSLLSLGVIGFVVGVISSFYSIFFRNIFLSILLVYLLLMLFTSFYRNIKYTFFVFLVSVGTHFSYGFGWLKGFFTKHKLDDRIK